MRLARRARGSTFILVLAMMTILVFLVSALSYTSRLESITSRNYAQAVQARTAAATGLPLALALLADTTTVTTPLQRWSKAPLVTGTLGPPDGAGAAPGAQAGRQSKSILAGEAVAALPDGSTIGRRGAADDNDRETTSSGPLRNGQAVVGVGDLSAKVNINTIRSARALERFLEQVSKSPAKGSGRAGSDLGGQASGIFAMRGESNETTRTVEGDLRILPPEGTRRFESLYDLERRGSAPSGEAEGFFSKDELAVLQQYMTTFSQSPEIFRRSDGFSHPRLSIHDLTPERTWHALSLAYPDKEPRLLMQFAANVADFTDEDDVPTFVTDPEHPEPWNGLFGVEQTALITEVYPDSRTLANFGDRGQYVEIHNPWSEPVDVEGWMLSVGSTKGGANSVRLSGTIRSGGYLLVTDNYDDPPAEAPSGTGSFLSVFGVRRDDGGRRLIDQAGFTLPDRNSLVSLTDAQGRLIDVFHFTDEGARDSLEAYQRDDPRVRGFRVADATPFGQPPEAARTGSVEVMSTVRLGWEKGNKPLESVVDLLRVSTSFAGVRKDSDGARSELYGWQTPVYVPVGRVERSNLDAGLLDVFTAVWPPASEDDLTSRAEAEAKVAAASDLLVPETRERADETTWPLLYAHGKLNLNTCDPVALYSLDAQVGGVDLITPAVVEQFASHRRNKLGLGEAPYLSPSEFVVQLVPRLENEDQAEVIGQLLEQVTVCSSSFEVLAENIVGAAGAAGQSGLSQTRSRVAWRIALDREPYSLIDYAVEP